MPNFTALNIISRVAHSEGVSAIVILQNSLYAMVYSAVALSAVIALPLEDRTPAEPVAGGPIVGSQLAAGSVVVPEPIVGSQPAAGSVVVQVVKSGVPLASVGLTAQLSRMTSSDSPPPRVIELVS